MAAKAVVPNDQKKAADAIRACVGILNARIDAAKKSVKDNQDEASMRLVMSAKSDIVGLERVAKRLEAAFYA